MFFLNINGHFKRLEKLNQRNCRTITGERFEAKVSCMYLTEKELFQLAYKPSYYKIHFSMIVGLPQDLGKGNKTGSCN